MHFPVLPFSRLAQTVKKPPTIGYPWHPQTLGEQILKRRLDLGLSQIEVARMLNLGPQTISRWECGTHIPQIKHYPQIIKFLDYYPFPADESDKEDRITRYRYINGISKKRFSKRKLLMG